MLLLDEDHQLLEDILLSRLTETGATGSSSADSYLNYPHDDPEIASEKTVKTILRNMAFAIDSLYHEKERLHSAVLDELPQDGTYKLFLMFFWLFTEDVCQCLPYSCTSLAP